jgi:head-tail adaptor
MAKRSRIGQRKTNITIKKLTKGIDADGYPTEEWTDVFGGKVKCLWVSAFGQEVFENHRAGETGNATVNMPYSPLVDNGCRVWYENEPQDDQHAFVIVGEPNNLERRELEFKVKRLVSA